MNRPPTAAATSASAPRPLAPTLVRLKHLAHRRVRAALGENHPDLDNLVQDALLRTVRAGQRAPLRAPDAYLATATTSVLRDHFRRRRTARAMREQLSQGAAAAPLRVPPLDELVELARLLQADPRLGRAFCALGVEFSERNVGQLFGTGRAAAAAFIRDCRVSLRAVRA